MNYKTIKIPESTYGAIKKAQVELVQTGLNNIPQEISQNCPFCKVHLNSVNVEYSYVECPKCHYQQQKFNINAGGTFALGIVIGLGVAALINMLNRKELSAKNKK